MNHFINCTSCSATTTAIQKHTKQCF